MRSATSSAPTAIEQIPHPEGRVDPVADAEVVDAELLLADLEQAQRRLERVRKQAGSGAREATEERDWLERVVEALGRGEPARGVPPPVRAPKAPADLQALSSKPVLYVANLDEGEDEPPDRAGRACAAPGRRVHRGQRPDRGGAGGAAPADQAAEMRSELGLAESGLQRLVRAAYELLDLVTFFTAHRGSEARARALRRGLTAWDAAGKVHTEIQAGFVRAEVIGWRELVDAGGYGEARDRGLIRAEGRDYVVEDGDVITIRH